MIDIKPLLDFSLKSERMFFNLNNDAQKKTINKKHSDIFQKIGPKLLFITFTNWLPFSKNTLFFKVHPPNYKKRKQK